MTGTKGNVVVERIKVGDTHYETAYGHWITVVVKTLPAKNKEGAWVWTSQIVNSNRIVDYSVHPEYTQYAPELYDYPAYMSREEYKKLKQAGIKAEISAAETTEHLEQT